MAKPKLRNAQDKAVKAKKADKTKPSKAPKVDKVERRHGVTVIRSKETAAAIGKIMSALNNKVDTVQVRLTEECMYLSASSDARAIEIKVPECYGSGEFAIGIESFTQILANKTEIECNLKKADLHFKNGRYNGTLKVMPYAKVKVVAEQENPITIPRGSGIIKHLNAALSNLRLAVSSTQDSDESFMCVKVEKGKLTCAVYDLMHGGVYSSDVDFKTDMLFNFKTDILNKVIQLGDRGDDYSLMLGQSSVYIEADNIRASISMTQIEATSFEAMLALITEAKKNRVAKTTISTDRLQSIIANMKAIYEAERSSIEVAINNGSMDFKYSTTYGRVEDGEKIDNEGTSNIKIRLPIFEDTVNTMPSGDVVFGIINKKLPGNFKRVQVYIESGNVGYLMNGSQ